MAGRVGGWLAGWMDGWVDGGPAPKEAVLPTYRLDGGGGRREDNKE